MHPMVNKNKNNNVEQQQQMKNKQIEQQQWNQSLGMVNNTITTKECETIRTTKNTYSMGIGQE